MDYKKSLLCITIVSALFFNGCLIKGRVLDENGVGINGVTVNLNGPVSMTTTTDSNGDYQFGTFRNYLPAGDYIITPSGEAAPSTRKVTIANNGNGFPMPVYGVYFVSGVNASLFPMHVGQVFENNSIDSDGDGGIWTASITDTTTINSRRYFVAEPSNDSNTFYFSSTKSAMYIIDQSGVMEWQIGTTTQTTFITTPYGGPYLAFVLRRTFSSNKYIDYYLVPGIGFMSYFYHEDGYWDRSELIGIE
jgi:hypothetical protein